MNELINFGHLRIMIAVAREGGVRRAAERIHLTQPAISQAIGKLEGALGAPLFTRAARGMFLTESGRMLADRIERAIGYLISGQREVGLRDGGNGDDAKALPRLATTTQLRALLEVVEHGGYTPAARWLGAAQPNVHRAVRDLEKLCGRKLFVPSKSGVEATPEARAFARWVSLAFREIEQGLDELRERKGENDGSILIGSLPLARARILPTAVSRLLTLHPDVKVKIVDGAYTELLGNLRRGQIDLILGALRIPPPGADVAQEPLFDEPLSIVVRSGHPILNRPELEPRELAKLDWIAPNDRTPARAQFAAFFRDRGVALPRRIIECSSLVAIRGLLLQSNRAALLSASQIHYEALAGDLAVAGGVLAGTERPIGISVRADWVPTSMQSRFLDLVREVAAKPG